jgi:hypothetical protein
VTVAQGRARRRVGLARGDVAGEHAPAFAPDAEKLALHLRREREEGRGDGAVEPRAGAHEVGGQDAGDEQGRGPRGQPPARRERGAGPDRQGDRPTDRGVAQDPLQLFGAQRQRMVRRKEAPHEHAGRRRQQPGPPWSGGQKGSARE